jgi:hypothetical protein
VFDVQGSTLETNMRRPKDCAIPICHHQVISISKAVGACLCEKEKKLLVPFLCSVYRRMNDQNISRTGSLALFSLFKLFQEPEIPGNFGAHVCFQKGKIDCNVLNALRPFKETAAAISKRGFQRAASKAAELDHVITTLTALESACQSVNNQRGYFM